MGQSIDLNLSYEKADAVTTAKINWTPEDDDNNYYYAVVQQVGFPEIKGEPIQGASEFKYDVVKACNTFGEFRLIRKIDFAIVGSKFFQTNESDFSKCASVTIPTVPSDSFDSFMNGPYYDLGGKVAFYPQPTPLSSKYSVGVSSSSCENPLCNLSSDGDGWFLQLQPGDKGTFYVYETIGLKVHSAIDFAYKPVTDWYPFKLTVKKNSEQGTLDISINDDQGIPMYMEYIYMWGGEINITGGEDDCEIKEFVWSCTGFTGSGQVILYVTTYEGTESYVLDQVDYQFAETSPSSSVVDNAGTGSTSPGGTSSGVVDLANIPLVKDIVIAQVLGTNQTEISCDAGCIDSLLANANMTGEIFVSVDGEPMQKLDATTKIKVGKSSSMKIEIRPTDGSEIFTSEIAFIERVESSKATSSATETINTTSPKTWVIFLLALSVLILIGFIPVIRARSKK